MDFVFLNLHVLGVLDGLEAVLNEDVSVQELLCFDFVQPFLDFAEFLFQDVVDNVGHCVLVHSEVGRVL